MWGGVSTSKPHTTLGIPPVLDCPATQNCLFAFRVPFPPPLPQNLFLFLPVPHFDLHTPPPCKPSTRRALQTDCSRAVLVMTRQRRGPHFMPIRLLPCIEPLPARPSSASHMSRRVTSTRAVVRQCGSRARQPLLQQGQTGQDSRCGWLSCPSWERLTQTRWLVA